MNELTKDSPYIVRTETREETNEVANYIKGEDSDWTHWNYVIHRGVNQPTNCILLTIAESQEYKHIPILTITQWRKLVEKDLDIEDKFTLPEKWYVRVIPSKVNILDIWKTKVSNRKYHETCIRYGVVRNTGEGSFIDRVNKDGIVELTWEQFEKYVLMENNKKEYWLKEGFEKVSEALFDTFKKDDFGGYKKFDQKSVLKEQYEKAEVLDIWFELKEVYIAPVKPELPKIRGYEGKVVETRQGTYFKYGCAELKREWFLETSSRGIASMTLNNGVTLYPEDVQAIKKYLKDEYEYNNKTKK